MLRKVQSDRKSLSGGAAVPAGPKEGVQAPMAGLGLWIFLAELTLHLPLGNVLGKNKAVGILNKDLCARENLPEGIKAPRLLMCHCPSDSRMTGLAQGSQRLPAQLQLPHPLGVSQRSLLCQSLGQGPLSAWERLGVPVPAPWLSTTGSSQAAQFQHTPLVPDPVPAAACLTTPHTGRASWEKGKKKKKKSQT